MVEDKNILEIKSKIITDIKSEVLNKQCEHVYLKKNEENVSNCVKELRDFFCEKNEESAGIAAPQIGYSLKIFIMKVTMV